jgi:hypothetical protein
VLQISVHPQHDSEVIICSHLVKICVKHVFLSIYKFKLIMYRVIFEVLIANLLPSGMGKRGVPNCAVFHPKFSS